MADGLLNKASIILTPTGYKAGTLYNVAPVVEPYEDFDFARASVASRVNSSGLVEMVGRTLGSNLVQNGDFSQLGSELVTDGDFPNLDNWSVNGGDYATIVDGALNSNNPENGNWHTENISQNISFVNGKTYKISFKAKNISGDPNLRLTQNGYVIFTDNITSSFVDYEVYYTASADNGSIRIFCNSAVGEFQIDNVSVKQVDPNDYWVKQSNWTIANGSANSNGTGLLYQTSVSYVDGKTYKVTFDASITSGGGTVRLGNTTPSTPFTNGSNVFYLQTDASNTTKYIFFQGNSFEGSIDNVSVKEVIDTNNIPRISYDSNGDNGHILLEPTSTNLITYSEDFTTWTVNSATTVYSNTTETLSPSGEYNASKITSDGSNGLYKVVAFSGGDNTKSIFLKGIVGGEQVKLKDPSQTITTETLTLTTDWVRYDLSENQTLNTGLWIDDIPSNGIYMWGAQLEALSYATSYIPTLTGSTETRATETATGAGSADLINSTEGVLYAEIAALRQVNDNIQFLAINSSSYTQNSIYIQLRSATNQIAVWAYSNGSNEVAEIITLTDVTAFNKIAIRWKVNDFNVFINGTSVFTDTSYNAPTSSSLNTLEFARGGSLNIYCKCKALAVFNEALSDAELNNLTG